MTKNIELDHVEVTDQMTPDEILGEMEKDVRAFYRVCKVMKFNDEGVKMILQQRLGKRASKHAIDSFYNCVLDTVACFGNDLEDACKKARAGEVDLVVAKVMEVKDDDSSAEPTKH
jgi:hypothetical protein